MRVQTLRILQTLCFAALVHPALGQERPSIKVQEPGCLPQDGQARVVAMVSSATPVTSMRVLFHSELSSADHYVEMRPSESDRNRYWAVLPKVLPEGKAVTLRIRLRTVDGIEVITPVEKLPPYKGCEVTLSREEKATARNLVVGQTKSEQPSFPPGFDCSDIVKQITFGGAMQSVFGCKPSVARASGSTLTPQTSAGGTRTSSQSTGGSGGGLVIGGMGGTSVGGGVIQGQSSPARPTPPPDIR